MSPTSHDGVTCRHRKISRHIVYQLQSHSSPLTHRTTRIRHSQRGCAQSIHLIHPSIHLSQQIIDSGQVYQVSSTPRPGQLTILLAVHPPIHQRTGN